MHDLVLDLETEKSFDEVGGRNHLDLLGVTVVGVYDYGTNTYKAYEQEEFDELGRVLKNARQIIGFNIRYFDIPVLAPHIKVNVRTLPLHDLLEDIERTIGFRVSLDSLSKATLNAQKSGHGLDALTWWRAGEKNKVKAYCLQDVKLTRDLYEYGKKFREVMYISKENGMKVKVPVRWDAVRERGVSETIHAAHEDRVAVKLVLKKSPWITGEPECITMDVRTLLDKGFKGYCHETRGERTIAFDECAQAQLTEKQYQLHADVQAGLF